MRYEVVLTEQAHEKACQFLLSHVRKGRSQEELCFALWRPSTGKTRTSALVFDIVLPVDGEHHLHGSVSFEPGYLTRAIKLACTEEVGLAFMHNHLTGGWQEMSDEDVTAERDRISPPTRASGFPLVGLTLGTDGSWSARFWTWDGYHFNRSWCDKVRVVGRMLRITFNDDKVPPPQRRAMLRRTIDTWGKVRQRDISCLRVGIVGVGSVGCIVAETLARIGIQKLVLIDPDKIEVHNLDRLLYAGQDDVGKYKVELVAQHLKNSATAENFDVQISKNLIQQEHTYLAALDCDILFAAVDRPTPKDLLNRIAYVHCIPVIFGGVFIDNKPNGSLGQAAWSVVTAGLGRRCLRCDGQYTTSDVSVERDGSLDDPSYVRQIATSHDARANQNVFPFSANLASFMVIEMVRLVAAEAWWPDTGGKLHYSMIPGRLHTEREQCGVNCSVYESIARGDQYSYPFIIEAVEKSNLPASKKFNNFIPDWCLDLLRKVRRQN